MDRKKFSGTKTLIVLALTVFVFLFGILLGSSLNAEKVDEVYQLSKELQMRTLGVDVEYEILEDSLCSSGDILSLADDLYEVSEKTEYMENTLGYDNENIKELKAYYFVLEAKHWLLAKKRYETCSMQLGGLEPLNRSVILYFYSNEGDCPKCGEQGTVLSYIKELYPGLMVYSFDLNFDSPVVDLYKGLYNIESQAPVLILNENVHEGYLNADDLIAWSENLNTK